MILVRNLLLQLSGNKIWVLSFCCCLLMMSCDSLKKVPTDVKPETETSEDLGEIQGGKVYNPETGRYENPSDLGSPVDTIEWTETPLEENPPITTDGKLPDGSSPKPGIDPGQNLDVYDVAVCLPFLGNRFKEYENEINSKSLLAINFYSGVKMAFDDLSSRGIRLNVDVLDTEASETKMNSILQSSELFEAEIIIGPVTTKNLKKTAEFAKKNKKVVISPLNANTKITSGNPYFVQTSPSLVSHCQAITKHALDNHSASELVLLVRDKGAEKNRLKYFQEAQKLYTGSTSVDPIKEFVIRDNTSDLQEVDLMPLIQQDKTTVFIVPSWSNENFIYALMRKISLIKGPNKVVVYGMPKWREYTRIDFDYYERLNLHISSNSNYDIYDEPVKIFRQRYFDRYGMAPEEDAIIGYDLMMYFGVMVNEHGTSFPQKIDGELADLLHTKLDFQAAQHTVNIENLDAVDFYENKMVNILKFEDYHFQSAK